MNWNKGLLSKILGLSKNKYFLIIRYSQQCNELLWWVVSSSFSKQSNDIWVLLLTWNFIMLTFVLMVIELWVGSIKKPLYSCIQSSLYMYILLNLLKWHSLIRLHLIILTFVLSLDTIHVIDDNVEHSGSKAEISFKNDISVDLILNSNNKDKNLIGKDLYNTQRNCIFCLININRTKYVISFNYIDQSVYISELRRLRAIEQPTTLSLLILPTNMCSVLLFIFMMYVYI